MNIGTVIVRINNLIEAEIMLDKNGDEVFAEVALTESDLRRLAAVQGFELVKPDKPKGVYFE